MAAENIVSGGLSAVIFLAAITLFLYLRRGGQDISHGLVEKLVSYGLGTFLLGLAIRISVESFIFDSLWFNLVGNGAAAALILVAYRRSGNFSQRGDITMALGSTVAPGIVAVIGFLAFPFRDRMESYLDSR